MKDAAESKARVESVLANEPGPSRDIVTLNAAAALYVSGVAASLWGRQWHLRVTRLRAARHAPSSITW